MTCYLAKFGKYIGNWRNIVENSLGNFMGTHWEQKKSNFRPVPLAQLANHGKASTQFLFLCKAELGFFHFLEIVTGWLVPSAGHKIPVQPDWYLLLVIRSQYSLAGTFHRRRSKLA
jgi:hypothetical protein